MPGHKGRRMLGPEPFDITEIDGADVLYSPHGIILKSEKNASDLYGTHRTVYSTEGSTLAIKAMLKLAFDRRRATGRDGVILAVRNVHKSFVNACALLGIEAEWIFPDSSGSICSSVITSETVRARLRELTVKPFAVYLTSPDYLGNIADVEGISRVCDEYGIPLLVDNAHGAYLAFLDESRHPIALGASMCADSAHKTLPVLTGGAYLHISKKCPEYSEDADRATSLFASTSPSYLTLASLDLCNDYLASRFKGELTSCIEKIRILKDRLCAIGIKTEESEPLKIVIRATSLGYTGKELAEHLRSASVEVEFSDCEYTVLMASTCNTDRDFERLYASLTQIERKEGVNLSTPHYVSVKAPTKAMSIREAVLSAHETVSADESVGRICATPTVSCPPAIPIAISGEVITERERDLFLLYGIDRVEVVI